MDDLEKAILFSYEPGGNVEPGVRSQAMAYCDQIKQAPSICRFCIERLSSTDLVPVQFWCLQTIHDSLRFRYSSMDPTERAFLRDSLISIARADDAKTFPVSGGPAFIRNKFAQVFVALLYSEYPSVWPTAFLDLIPHLGKRVPIVIDMFTRVLHSLDDELISMDYPRSTDEIAVAGRIKDAMREQCITQIAGAWYTIVSLYRNSDPDTVAMVLDTVRRYIAWIDIGLIANDAFVPLIFDIVLNSNVNVNVNNNDNNNNAPSSSSEQLRATAAGCILALVSKRMDPHQKLVLLHNLQINRVFSLVTGSDDDSELVLSKLAALITRYASEALECSKQLGSRDVDGASMKLLEDALPAVFSIMQNHEVDSHFLSDYVSATMKSQSPSPKQAVHMGQILGVIRGQICYDPIYRNNLELLDKIGQEEEDQMVERRKELFTLLRGVGRVAPEATQLFVRNLLTNVLASSEMNVEEVEAALSLFYHLGDSMSDSEMRAGSGLLREFVPMLLSARFSCHSHRIVAIVYLETVMKYMKFVQENAQYVPLVLTAFLDDRGMRHPNLNVRRRASYLFMRTVKLLKAELVPFIETILQSLLDTVASFTSLDCTSKGLNRSGSKDDSHTFEAIGLLLGMDIVSPEKQSKYLSGLLNPLCHQVESLLLDARAHRLEESSMKIGGLQEVIVAINALSKGFSERLVTTIHPEIGIMFKQMLDVLLQILVLFPDVDPLRHKITSFLHRMVEILGASVFPYLPMVLEQLLAKSEPKEMVNFLVLINQLVCKFNTTVGGILEEVFPAIASRLFHTLPRDALPLGPGSNTEEIRELQELQRTFFMFLHVLATHDLSSILLAPKSRRYLDLIMQLLLSTSCNHKDIVDRKLCVQIIVRLIKDWCTICNGEEKVPGFRSFIIETFATNCCLYSVLDKSFEFKDSSTLVLFGEIVVAQKVMYEQFGDDFVIQFVSKGLPAAQCPQDLAEQYYLKLQGNDIKALKDFYQSLIENLRRQQNGSLDVR